jgi:hypothetical protein
MKKFLLVLAVLFMVSCSKYSLRQDVCDVSDATVDGGKIYYVTTELSMAKDILEPRLAYKSVVNCFTSDLESTKEKEYQKAINLYLKVKENMK